VPLPVQCQRICRHELSWITPLRSPCGNEGTLRVEELNPVGLSIRDVNVAGRIDSCVNRLDKLAIASAVAPKRTDGCAIGGEDFDLLSIGDAEVACGVDAEAGRIIELTAGPGRAELEQEAAIRRELLGIPAFHVNDIDIAI
jgi:hypothetical protein